jgi:hypothetical protein
MSSVSNPILGTSENIEDFKQQKETAIKEVERNKERLGMVAFYKSKLEKEIASHKNSDIKEIKDELIELIHSYHKFHEIVEILFNLSNVNTKYVQDILETKYPKTKGGSKGGRAKRVRKTLKNKRKCKSRIRKSCRHKK